MKLKNPLIDEISAARWQELYWGPESGHPSIASLAERFGVGAEAIRNRLRKFGIVTRTMSEQLALDIKHGRRKASHPGPRSVEHLVDYWSGRKQARKHVSKRAAARVTTPEEVPCSWCGAPMPRVTAERRRRAFFACSASHRNYYAWHCRLREGEPRPLIVDRLQQLSEERLKRLRDRNPDGTLRPPSWEQLEKLAEEIGAREPEIMEVLDRYGVFGD
jgi:hypothetical protein